MTLTLIFFSILSVLAIASAIVTIASRQPVKSAMALVVHFFMLSGLYLTLNAQFLAVLQILVYAGAIMVLVISVSYTHLDVYKRQESPFRVKHTIETIMEIDETREVAIARELTKKFEQVETANVREIYNKLDNEINLKGEFVIIIDAVNEADKVHWWTELTVYEHVIHYIETGMQSKEAIKQTAVDRNMKKNEVYDIYHIEH